MFRIRDILRRIWIWIWILGYENWITNPAPDPALFVSGFQMQKKLDFFQVDLLIAYYRYIYISLQR